MIIPAQEQTTPTSIQALAQAPVPQADQDRKRLMREAWKAYRGEFPHPLKVEKDQPDDNIICNFCGPIVDKGASWLFGQDVKIEATQEATGETQETSTKETTIQDFIDGLWGDDDDKMSLLGDTGTNGGVCGQPFLKLVPPQGHMKYPRIVVMDPMLVRMVTAPDDCSLILAYIIEYPGVGVEKRQIIARIDPDGLAGIAGEYDLDDTWQIANYERNNQYGTQQNSWYQVGPIEMWDYPFPPIFTNKNLPNPNEPWGMPDLTSDIIDQNKSLNFLFSNLARIVKFHGHPITWIKGVGTGQISVAVGDVIVLNSVDATMGTLTPMENFAGILSVIATIMSNIDQQSRIPAVALGRQEALPKLGNISGVALSLMFQPLIEKTEQKRRAYGKLIREVTRAALVLAGLLSIEDYEDFKIGLHWQPLLPADNLTAAQEALLLQQIGISMSTILAGLGYDADDEMDKKAQEDTKTATNFAQGKGLPPMPPTMPGQPPTVQPTGVQAQ